jgi:hypothetical protein
LMIENIGFYYRLGFIETHRVSEKGYDRVYMTKAPARERRTKGSARLMNTNQLEHFQDD